MPDQREAPLTILYRDEALIAIHKPSGLLTHRTPLAFGETRFALQMLRDQIGQFVYPAHRLDRGTSGILIFALSSETAKALGDAFETQQVQKRYQAIVRGHPPISGQIDHPLTRQRDPYEPGGDRLSDTPQDASTRYERLNCYELPYQVDRYPSSRYALLELTPLTGRRHQIRRHLKHIAHPIIGDATHGKGQHNRLFTQLFGTQRLLLCCTTMTLPHPTTGQSLTLEAPPAEDFNSVIQQLMPFQLPKAA